MTERNHISDDQLKLLSMGEPDDQQLQEIADHVAACVQCRHRVDSIAAEPELWKMASRLSSEQSFAVSTNLRHRSQPDFISGSKVTQPRESISVEHLLDDPSHPEMMGRIGGYDIEREIGRGGMGIVFKAFDTEVNRPLAIKVLSPRLAENGTARQRFAREARAAAAVLHPNVVAIYGVNSSHEVPYLVMPYVAGTSLQRFIEEHGPLDEKEVVRMALQVAAGLGAAHAQGLVHRDIKPGNILVESHVSRAMVTDFGLARAIGDASVTQTGCFVGTPNYMSPEQALGKRIDARSDLFSLGSVMYFMATGHVPFLADSPLCVLNRTANDEAIPVRQLNNEISQTLCDIIDRLLEKDAAARFQSSAELHEVLEQYLAYLHQPDAPMPRVVQTVRATQQLFGSFGNPVRKTLLAVIVMASLVVGIGLGKGWLPIPLRAASPAADSPREILGVAFDTGEGLPIFEKNIAQRVFIGADGRLDLDIDTGSVEFLSGDDEKLVVEVLRTVAAVDEQQADQLAQRHQLKLASKNGDVSIKAAFDDKFKDVSGPSRFRSIVFRVFVPLNCDLDVKSPQLENVVVADEVESRIRLETTREDVQLNSEVNH